MRSPGGTPGGMGSFLAGSNGKSLAGRGLTAAGALIILAGIIANLGIYFQPSSLFDTLLILVLIAGGIGLVARSVRAYSTPA